MFNRLERHGYARRVRNPVDKRNINVAALNVTAFNERMEQLLGSLRRMRAPSSKYSSQEMALIDGFIKSAVAISSDETLLRRAAAR